MWCAIQLLALYLQGGKQLSTVDDDRAVQVIGR